MITRLGLPFGKPLCDDYAYPDALEPDGPIVVEGPLDMQSLWQWTQYRRQYTLLAMHGTYFSTEALSRFERFRRIYTTLDADGGGERATMRLAVSNLGEPCCTVRFASVSTSSCGYSTSQAPGPHDVCFITHTDKRLGSNTARIMQRNYAVCLNERGGAV